MRRQFKNFMKWKGLNAMQKEELKEVIRNYVNNEKANYAVLIDGAWGSGKTYFYEHELKEDISKIENGKNHRKVNVYISLYGISSIEQLSKELLTNFLVGARLQGDKQRQKVYRQVSRVMGILSKSFSFSISGVSVNLDEFINELKNNIDLKDMIICLDDFERCAVPVNELFGMINSLVEHCNCKVIILADEDNIGKMYANTNVEAKYLTLLTGKSLIVKQENKAQIGVNNGSGSANVNEITAEELKKFNEEIYSENYIYKDIKEKVIGLTLKYTSNLRDEYQPVLTDTVNSPELSAMLLQKKETILEWMNRCKNRNIRIMKRWLLHFERIYEVIQKNYTDSQYSRYFDKIFDRFAAYSIRVACALGNNRPLHNWGKDIEIGFVSLGDDVFADRQGYRFIDDFFIDLVLKEERVCHAAKVIIKEAQEEENYNREAAKGQAYKKLTQWYFLEEEEVSRNLQCLKAEIEKDEYTPQSYQHMIALLVILNKKELVEKAFIEDITAILKNKLAERKDKIDVENFGQDLPDQDSQELFRELYDPLYSLIMEKNRELDKQEIDLMLDYSSGTGFMHYCFENADKFLLKKSFMQYIDFDKLINVIRTGDLKGIYDIASGFEKVYGFDNLREFYEEDADMLKDLAERLQNLDCKGKTRKYAIKVLCDTLRKKVNMIESKEQC